MTRKERWILSEFQVARDRSRAERLLAHRLKTPFAEIDLLTEARDRSLILLEVKTCSGEWGPELMPRKQRVRLTRARAYLEDQNGKEVRLVLAAVYPRGFVNGRLDSDLRYFDLTARLY